jgi:hypothetical protein
MVPTIKQLMKRHMGPRKNCSRQFCEPSAVRAALHATHTHPGEERATLAPLRTWMWSYDITSALDTTPSPSASKCDSATTACSEMTSQSTNIVLRRRTLAPLARPARCGWGQHDDSGWRCGVNR